MGYVYILACDNRNTTYVGVTNDLMRRLYEHKHGVLEGFTKRYHVHRLVYFEVFHDIKDAIAREKQLKGWRKSKKQLLIERMNPEWRDLSEEWGLGE